MQGFESWDVGFLNCTTQIVVADGIYSHDKYNCQKSCDNIRTFDKT